MSEQDISSLLIEKIKALEEDTVLEIVKERMDKQNDFSKIIEDAKAGMREVGRLYEQKTYFLSGLMIAGDIFKQIVKLVEPKVSQSLHGKNSGHILLGTVHGDIHDIGKNLFKTLLQCQGFTVTDLGVDIPPERFKEHSQKIKPDVVALSGLTTVSYDAMKETVKQIRSINKKSISKTPIIIGGGLTNAEVCRYTGADYWSIDGSVGVKLCSEIIEEAQSLKKN